MALWPRTFFVSAMLQRAAATTTASQQIVACLTHMNSITRPQSLLLQTPRLFSPALWWSFQRLRTNLHRLDSDCCGKTRLLIATARV